MKLDRQKFEIARARACMGAKDFEAAGIPKGTLCRAMSGRSLRFHIPVILQKRQYGI